MSTPAESPPRPSARRWFVPVALAVAALLGSGYYLAPWRESPAEAWDEIAAAAEAGGYGAVWDRFDPASQERMARRLQELVPDPGLSDRDRYARLLGWREDTRIQFLPGPVVRVTRSGDHAVVELDREDPLRPGQRPQRVSWPGTAGGGCSASGPTRPGEGEVR
jgi:hypothetical protein